MKKALLNYLFVSIILFSNLDSFSKEIKPEIGICPTAIITYSSSSFCKSSNSENVFLSGNGNYFGGIYSSSPVGLSINPITGTINPSQSTSGSYVVEYTIPATIDCPAFQALTTVTIINQLNSGTPIAVMPTICENSTETINLFDLITGEDSGGVWVRTSGVGGVFNAAAGTFTVTSETTDSSFTYTVNGSFPCTPSSTIVTIFIVAASNAGSDGSITVSDTSIVPINLSSIITGEQPGGVWVRISGTGGTFNAATGAFTLAIGATTSTFVYTLYGNAPCGNSSSIATVIIQPNLDTNQFSGNQFNLSPNPVKDILKIENNVLINAIKIQNQLGQVILEKNINSTNTTVDFSTFNSGVYFILFESEKGLEYKKVIKNN